MGAPSACPGSNLWGPSCPGPKEAPPSASFPLHTPPPPSPAPIPGEGLHPWETQACAFSGSWFSRELWLEGDGRSSPGVGGVGSGGSRTGNWKWKGVGGPGSSLPPTFLLLPGPSPCWLALGGRGWAQAPPGGRRAGDLSAAPPKQGGEAATPPPPPPQLRPVAQPLLVHWREART